MGIADPRGNEESLPVRLEVELHALAQPLTSLQCRLEIGLLLPGDGTAREALEDGLAELRRALVRLSRIREVGRVASSERLTR